MNKDSILIIDFGSQYTLLLAKSVRKCGVYSEIVSPDISKEKIKLINPKGIILSGSPFSVYEDNAPHISNEIVSFGIPILGVCYGMQELVRFFGGRVVPNKDNIREYGGTNIHIKKSHELLMEWKKKSLCG
jgi:GMP synthase (glutamine-hydrolysing)